LDPSILGALLNFGAIGVVLFLIMVGWLVPKPYYTKVVQENEDLRKAGAIDRQRANEVAGTASVTNQLLGAITDMARDKQQHDGRGPKPAGFDPNWKDISR
jgi:hypothetical protein